MTVESGLVVKQADLSRALPPKWAWSQRLILSYLNLLIGNEGIGKGTLMAWIIARLSRGHLPGDLKGIPVGVGVLGDEDDFDSVWTPRLHAAGADLTRVFQIERPGGGFVSLTEDRERLLIEIRQKDLKVLFFDQLLDNLGVGVDDWRQKPVRDGLQPIRSLARETEILALGSLHPNKRAESFRQLMSGSAAFNAVSRSSLLVAQHPDDEDIRVLARGKGNHSQAPPALEFRIEGHSFAANGHQFNVPLATGFEEGTLTVNDLLGNDTVREEHSKVAEACECISSLLPRDGNWHPAKAIKEAAEADGIDERTVTRAKLRLKIEHHRTETFPAVTEWRWPTSDTVRTAGESVRSVPTVLTVLSSSQDSQDTQDSQDVGTKPVRSALTCGHARAWRVSPAHSWTCAKCYPPASADVEWEMAA